MIMCENYNLDRCVVKMVGTVIVMLTEVYDAIS